MDRWVDGRMHGWMERWVDGWMDRWVARWVDGWIDGWISTITRKMPKGQNTEHIKISCI